MSKIEAGRVVLNETIFDLYHMLDSLKNMLKLKAEAKGLHLIFECATEVPQHVSTDEIKLRQVLINLLGNAIKFTQQGRVTLRVVSLVRSQIVGKEGEHTDPRVIQFEVEDTGVGIAGEELFNVFKPFVQTTSGRKSQEGTGLGLPISRKFIRLMGGNIAFSSGLGKGTTFTFDITVQAIKRPEEIKESRELAKGAIAEVLTTNLTRILLAEDNAVNQKVALRMLSKLGYEADVVQNGKEVLETLRHHDYDIILMDIQMPEMDGLETTKHILEYEGDRPCPIIIAMTANAMKEDRDRYLQAGMQDHIAKPIRLEELERALKYWGRK
jgi:CheY-like chemotaxis protein